MAVVPLVRALSKLGLLSRREAGIAILEGRVRVDGQVVRDQAVPVVLGRSVVEVDGQQPTDQPWRTILLHKPRGVVTTTRDPDGRPTVFDALGEAGQGLKTVGRLDLASTGLLLLTNDSHLADWLTNPDNAVPRVYIVTVRGRVDEALLGRLRDGIVDRDERLAASDVTLLKASGRESHLRVELREGRNREIRRLFNAVGHEVTRLKRVGFGPLALGDLPPGHWREVTADEILQGFGAQALHA